MIKLYKEKKKEMKSAVFISDQEFIRLSTSSGEQFAKCFRKAKNNYAALIILYDLVDYILELEGRTDEAYEDRNLLVDLLRSEIKEVLDKTPPF